MKNILGYFLIFISIVIIFYVIFLNTRPGRTTNTFSKFTFLTSTWEKYKTQFINQDGRVIDYQQGGITTSEGQSYALLRAVWLSDRDTFDRVWNFTKNSMKRPSDNLFGWRWGKKSNGQYGFQSESDMNSATDADEDIAFALILASRRWNTDSYASDAQKILNDLWKIDVVNVNNGNFLIAGNWAKNSSQIIINPSYFAPYEYRMFAEVDTKHDWNSLLTPGYDMISIASTSPLDKDKSVGLPPDWIAINRSNGDITAPTDNNLTTNYSFDAVRLPWRVALDYKWNNEQRAKQYLTNQFTFLSNLYKQNNLLDASYTHDGSVKDNFESPTMYATALGFLLVSDPKLADQVYQNKILTLYSNDTNSFVKKLQYYDQNWVWFGAALYNNQLPKL